MKVTVNLVGPDKQLAIDGVIYHAPDNFIAGLRVILKSAQAMWPVETGDYRLTKKRTRNGPATNDLHPAKSDRGEGERTVRSGRTDK